MRFKNILLILIFGTFSLYAYELPEMILISGSNVLIGDNQLNERLGPDAPKNPANVYTEHIVHLTDYYISKYEISISEFVEYLNETQTVTQVEERSILDNYWGYFLEKWPNHPVQSITWKEALSYCSWLSEKTGDRYRLPTDAEWDYAASGNNHYLYPWGNNYEKLDKSQDFDPWVDDILFKKHVYPIGYFEKDTSEFGVQGMYGNVEEYVLDAYDPFQYDKSSQNNPLNIYYPLGFQMINRGQTGYVYETDLYGLRERNWSGQNSPYSVRGFRVVKEADKTLFNSDSETPFYFDYSQRKIKSETQIYDYINGSPKAGMHFKANETIISLYINQGTLDNQWIYVLTDDIRHGWIKAENTTILE